MKDERVARLAVSCHLIARNGSKGDHPDIQHADRDQFADKQYEADGEGESEKRELLVTLDASRFTFGFEEFVKRHEQPRDQHQRPDLEQPPHVVNLIDVNFTTCTTHRYTIIQLG